MPLSGALAASFGWETVFYVFGGLGAIWFGVWCIFIKGNYFENEAVSRELRSTTNLEDASNVDENYKGIKYLLEAINFLNQK